MSTVTTSRIGRILGYDGPVATMMLSGFQYFLVSASFVACLAPTLLFHALVGWQATHLALWLGAASLLTIVPGMQALIVAAHRLLDRRAHAGRAFWATFADAARSRWGAAALLSGGVVVLGYDIVLLGSDAAVLLGAAACAALVLALLLASCFAVAEGSRLHGLALGLAAGRLVLLRPHLALAWLLLAGLAAVATTLPVIGAVAWLSAPALAAVAAVICNRTLGFGGARERTGS